MCSEKTKINVAQIMITLDNRGIDEALSMLRTFEGVSSNKALARKLRIEESTILNIQERWEFMQFIDLFFPEAQQAYYNYIAESCGF